MKAHSRAVVHAGGRLGELHCTPPLTLRRVRSEQDECALCLVGSAAGPLAGDELIAELLIDDEARATLVATGAAIAQGRGGPAAASMSWRVDMGHHARLTADPGPLIVCEGCQVDVEVAIALQETSQLEWRELVVLGRSTDAVPGAATIGWNVTRADHPVLRQHVDLRDPRMTGGHPVLASTLLTGPDVAARTVVHTRTSIAQQIDEHTVLLTVLGDSAAAVNRASAALRAEF